MARVLAAAALAALAVCAGSVWTQARAQAPLNLSADQQNRLMMQALGVAALRPGRSGDPAGPNPANYDEAKANPYPSLPDPLRLPDGRRVTSSTMWWSEKRPQIVRDYEDAVYGHVPADVPRVAWKVAAAERERLGFGGPAVLARRVVGHVDNTADPDIDVDIRMMVVTPAAARGPAPMLVMFTSDLFGGADFPAPNPPSRAEMERIDAALKAVLGQRDPALAKVFADHPGYRLQSPPPLRLPERNADGDPPSIEELIAAGWGYAALDASSIQADDGAGLTRGIIGLVNRGRPRKPQDWGALRAWAWGASRAFDFLAADPAVDPKRIGVEGVSRFGKAALVAMAFDPRFAMALVGSSGKGGTTPLRRDWGEDVSNLATGESYWMAGNFLKYDGPLTPGDLPVDSDELIALCAPRLTFISYGVPEKGDARWLDHRGSWMAAVAASPVWDLLGVKGLPGVRDAGPVPPMPPVNAGLLSGDLAWRQHDGGHTDAPNMKFFIPWADAHFADLSPATRAGVAVGGGGA